MNIRTSICILLTTSLLTVSSAFAQDYDLVILNGRGMDLEALFDDIPNVGIQGGRIVEFSIEKLVGKKTVDPTGLTTPSTKKHQTYATNNDAHQPQK